MRYLPDNHHDVLIAGAGPVGLWLACELQLSGCSVLVLEAAPTPYSALKSPPFGLRGLSVPTIEALDRRGLLNAVQERAINSRTPGTAHWAQQPRRSAGHFAGIPFFHDQVDASHWPHLLTNETTQLATDLASFEAVLTARAEALDIPIRRGCAVESVGQLDDAVLVRAGGETFTGRWLVGCDGGRSVVRKTSGIGFAGTDPEFTGYSVEVELADPSQLQPGRHYTTTGMYLYNPPGTVAMADFDGGAFHRTVPITRDHVETVLRKVTGTDVQVTSIGTAATWTDRAFQATTYRQGRVLLAGDAAHVHSPLGGQGLNLGLGDAMNLGWKLAATVRGGAPAALLDTYEEERRPVGARILDWSRAQVALMRPSPSSRALEAIMRDLLGTRDGATYFAGRIWGVDVRYDLGSHQSLVGRSAPNVLLEDGARLNGRLRDGRGVLVDLGGDISLTLLAKRWGDRLVYVPAAGAALSGAAPPDVTAMLVRPDGVVAWAGGSIKTAEVEQVISQWFGAPSDVVP